MADLRQGEQGLQNFTALMDLVPRQENMLQRMGMFSVVDYTTERVTEFERRVLGIDTDKVYMLTFALNSAICGIAGVLVSMIWVLQPFYGIVYSLRTFAIVTAAGLGNLPGVIGMSFVLGWVEQYAGIIAGAEWQVASAVFVLISVLLWRQIQLRRQRQVVR